MPQTFQVLRCFKCLVFQVHQTKKSIKWECKLCGEKQSIKRHYGIGIAKDCRLHVQKLNSLRGEIDEYKCGQMKRNQESDDDGNDENVIDDSEPQKVTPQVEQLKNSKWANYVEECEPIVNDEESMCLGDAEVVLELPKKRRRQFKNYCRSNYNSIHITDDTNHRIIKCYQTKNEIDETPERECDINTRSVEVKAYLPDIHNIIEKENSKPSISYNNYIPPRTNKTSKWDGFTKVDTSQKNTIENDSSKPSASNKNFIAPIINKISKCDDFQEYQPESSQDNTIKIETSKPSVSHKNFIAPTINKNSKWAEFLEDEEELDLNLSPSIEMSQKKEIFSLCDDNELDSVLDL